jgi:hypothetical protein
MVDLSSSLCKRLPEGIISGCLDIQYPFIFYIFYIFLAAVQPIHWSIKKHFVDQRTSTSSQRHFRLDSSLICWLSGSTPRFCWCFLFKDAMFAEIVRTTVRRTIWRTSRRLAAWQTRATRRGSRRPWSWTWVWTCVSASANGARWGSRCVRVSGLRKRGNMKQPIEVVRCSI